MTLRFGLNSITPSTGGGGSANIESLSITPSTSAQTITASGGVDGYSPISVSAVTASIDANITAGNIKKDVQILGVTGTYEGGSSAKYGMTMNDFLGDTDANGKLLAVANTYSLDFSGVEDIGDNALLKKFYIDKKVSSVAFSDLITISGAYALGQAFYSSSATSLDMSSLVTVSGEYALNDAFSHLSSDSTADLSSLKTVSGSTACKSMFWRQGNEGYLTSIDLSSLEDVTGGEACSGMLAGQIKLPSTFNSLPKLKTIRGSQGMTSFLQGVYGQAGYITTFSFPLLNTMSGPYAMRYFFRYRTALQHVYFNALTTSSFGASKNQFSDMLGDITGCTIHFPSNLSAKVATLIGYPNFGGTDTVIAFDLTATE